MSKRKWASLSLLEAIRPEYGWKTDYAVFGSYSADPIVLVAVLLALAGRDDDRGSGSAVDLADTIEELRRRVVFLVQKGRMSVPIKAQTVLKVLDNFVREVPCDESSESWHPKVALVRQSSEDQKQHCWRFWMGSRNLSRDRSWDVGFLLVGAVEKTGREVPGLIDAAKLLWNMEGLNQSDIKDRAKELRHVNWVYPPGCKVEEIMFLHPKTIDRQFMIEPKCLDSLLVVSPFLDGNIVKILGKWGSKTNRTLLSTHLALSRIAAQKENLLKKCFNKDNVLYMSECREDEILVVPGEEEAIEDKSEDAEEDHIGLHAKIILVSHKGHTTVWLGSPNATERAWKKNYEIVARLSLHKDLAKEIITFVKGANVFDARDLKPEPVLKEQDIIESAYKQVVSRWQVRQKDWTLYTDRPPHPDNPKVMLEVGTFSGDLVQWPRKTKILKLHRESPSIETEFVQVRISLKKANRVWLQKAPLDSPPGLTRDRNAVATILSPNVFLKWIKSILDDLPPGGETWDGQRNHTKRPSNPERYVPTMEDILKAWTRKPSILKMLDTRMKAYMRFVRASSGKSKDKEMLLLEDFEKMWKNIRSELCGEE